MSNKIISFGKYKGQPLETMLADDSYREWLMGQEWFRERYVNLYQTIINYGAEAVDTPEHNAIQVLFLNEDFCRALIKHAWPELPELTCKTSKISCRFEEGSPPIDVLLQVTYGEYQGPCCEGRVSCKNCIERIIHDTYLLIEIKPTVGDDYPSIIRQIKSTRSNNQNNRSVLYGKRLYSHALTIHTYTGTGATREQFVKTLRNEYIRVVFLDEIAQ